MPPEQTPPKVFISYSHDSQEHFDRILLLSDTLREWGIDCHIDQYELAPADWLRWMERRIREADFVLVVCTATYCRRFNGEEEPGKGLGVRHEGGVISAELYNRQTETAKFIPVVFSATDSAHIPTPLQATNRHTLNIEQLETDRGFENLYRQLTNQPQVIPKPLGKMRSLSPINRQEDFDEPKIKAPSPIIQPPKPKLVHQNFTEDLGNGVKLEMIAIPGGSFLMGSEDFEDTKPIHKVRITAFHIAKFAITQAQWKAVMGSNPAHFKKDNLPVESVSWYDAVRFCKKLCEQTDKNFRLPSEAEWEYACLAGSSGKYCFGDDKALLKDYAWYNEISDRKTHPVGEKKPNKWGLYDMHGNVWEWCEDRYNANYYAELSSQKSVVNPRGPESGDLRVLRGGSWFNSPSVIVGARRGYSWQSQDNHTFGIRVVMSRRRSF